MLGRLVRIAVVTVILVIGGGALAHALWSVTRPLPAVTITTSDFTLNAEWLAEPDLTGLFPGDSRTGTATVSLNSAASWHYRVTTTVAGPLAAHLTTQWYPSAQCTGTPLDPNQANGHTLTGGAATEFCIRFTLAPDTPNSMQGATSQVSVDVAAEQVLP